METITIEQNDDLDKLLLSNLEPELVKIVKAILRDARNQVSRDARSAMVNDPMETYRAVKRLLYKQVLGGNISLYNKKKRSGKSYPVPAQEVRYERGGNRMKRSARTEQLMSYSGSDRAFVLRWVTGGTKERYHVGGRRTGNISPNPWFEQSAERALMQAVENHKADFERLIKSIQV